MFGDNNKNSYLGFGISLGLLVGTLLAIFIGMLTKSTLVWAFTPGLGMLIGMNIGIILNAKKDRK